MVRRPAGGTLEADGSTRGRGATCRLASLWGLPQTPHARAEAAEAHRVVQASERFGKIVLQMG